MEMHSRGFSRILLCGGVAVAAFVGLGAAHAAHAQTREAGSTQPGAATPASDAGNTLGEVIVTATRSSQSLQKTPAAVTVLTADVLVQTGVVDMEDLGKLVPNLSFDNGFRAGVPQVSLRGIPTSQGGEAPLAFIVDGAQAPALDFINQDLLDLQSVQVLLGPQGALYGRGAIGGAIIITTKQPTDEFHDTFDAVYGNGDLGRIINTASGALVPGKLWASLTVEGETFGGLINDVGTGKPADWSREQSGRLNFLYKPTDSTTISLTWSHMQGLDGASYVEMVPTSDIYNFTAFKPDRNVDTSDTRHIDTLVERIDQATPFGTFTSISQEAQAKAATFGDGDFSPAPAAIAFNPVRVQAFNEDIRFTSLPGTPFQWLIGGFFQYRDTVNFLHVYGEAGGPLAGALLDLEDEDSKSVAYAEYGQASYDFPGGLKVTAALRYDTDDRYDNDKTADTPTVNTAIHHDFSSVQPSGTISKQWTSDLLTYATIGKGFRSGGFNAFGDTQNFPGVVQREFPSETDVNYEIGMKSQWFDRTLTVNADVFHTDYTNEQYFLINVEPPARDIVTLKSVSINGGELSIVYSPIHSLTLGGDLGVAYSRINSDDGIGDRGKYSPDAPLYTANLNAQYEWHAFANYNYNARIDYEYKGPIYYDPENSADFHPVGFLNLRLALENGRYSFALWGKNVTGTKYPLFFNPNAFGPNVGGREPNEPATYGIEFRYTL